jgi:uncharacterized membrane protein
MLGRRTRSRTVVADVVSGVSSYADAIAHDGELRRRLVSATRAGIAAKRRAKRQAGLAGIAARLGSDRVLRAQVAEVTRQLRRAQKRVQRRQRHTTRTVLIVAAGAGVAAVAIPPVRRALVSAARALAGSGVGGVQEEIEVAVPVSAAYRQWTQFEEFPSFMEGVDEVKQLDDTLLHWAVTVAGRRAEWDAKIVERKPDRRITWASVDGKNTWGSVTFEPLGAERTRIRLAMSFAADGAAEQAGSALGLDTQRVRGDLERFRDLVEGGSVSSRS